MKAMLVTVDCAFFTPFVFDFSRFDVERLAPLKNEQPNLVTFEFYAQHGSLRFSGSLRQSSHNLCLGHRAVWSSPLRAVPCANLRRLYFADRFDFATRGSSGSYEPGPGVSWGRKGRAFWLLVVPKAGRSLLDFETLFCAST